MIILFIVYQISLFIEISMDKEEEGLDLSIYILLQSELK